jgi:arginine decarboxylase
MAVDKLKSLVSGDDKLDQSEAPILDAIRDYLADDITSFVVPAHKQGRSLERETLDALGADTYRHDIAMLNGLDDMNESLELQERAQELAADLFGAKKSFFLVNGSTLSVQCAVTAVAGPGEKLLVGRNVHKSIVSGLIIGGIEPVFLTPGFDDELDLSHGIAVDAVERTLDEHPDARGVVIVTPTYYGVTSDVAAIANACHERGVPLVTDDAWGGHFPFHPDLPAASLPSGADVAIASFHKTLTGLQQASILSIQGDLVDPTIVNYRIGLVETSSVSSLILASMDAARRSLALHGRDALDVTMRLARRARDEIATIRGLQLMGREVIGRDGAHDLDETKLVIDVSGLGTNGYAAAEWLRTERKVLVELADPRRVMATVTVADDDETIGRLVAALRALAERPNRAIRATPGLPPSSALRTELAMLPRDAYFARAEHVAADDAVGRIAAEKVTPYPPGVPVLVPGERITRPILDYLKAGVAIGMNVTDVADSQLETLRVVV